MPSITPFNTSAKTKLIALTVNIPEVKATSKSGNNYTIAGGTTVTGGQGTQNLQPYLDYIDAIEVAIGHAIDDWRHKARFKDVKVVSCSAIGASGCLTGPELEPVIRSMGPQSPGWKQQCTNAIAKGLSKSWKLWADYVMIPGLPMYPAFTCWPGPVAPPLANIPFPLISCPSAKSAALSAPSLTSEFCAQLLNAAQIQKNVLASIASALSLAITIWMPSQQVMLVMGQGKNPSFPMPGPVQGTASGYGLRA